MVGIRLQAVVDVGNDQRFIGPDGRERIDQDGGIPPAGAGDQQNRRTRGQQAAQRGEQPLLDDGRQRPGRRRQTLVSLNLP